VKGSIKFSISGLLCSEGKSIFLQPLQTTTNITMPLTATQLTAFWTSPAQMGLTARTCTQIAAEGLVTSDDLEDFNDEADWKGCSSFS
jgi:hypothetical protein